MHPHLNYNTIIDNTEHLALLFWLAGSRHSLWDCNSLCPGRWNVLNRQKWLPYFLSGFSFGQCSCFSGVVPWVGSFEEPEAGLEFSPPTAPALWPRLTETLAPGPGTAPSRLADCSRASECSLAFMRRAATLAVRLLWHP